jgi:hypothetical protein
MLFYLPLHFLVTESGNKLIGHCLDYDLVVSADTYHETLRRLTFIVGAHVRTAERVGAGEQTLKHSAPEMYWNKFKHFRGEDSQETVSGVLCEVARTTSHNALQ